MRVRTTCLALALGITSLSISADEKPGDRDKHAWDGKSGKEVYESVCFACHKDGVADAPKLGDKAGWAELIEEGQDILTAHAWIGIRAMPAKGGQPDMNLVAFADAVAYMASQSGADWKTPDENMLEKIREEAILRLDAHAAELQEMRLDLDKQTKAYMERRLQQMEAKLNALAK